MDKKLEARIAKLEKLLSRKNESVMLDDSDKRYVSNCVSKATAALNKAKPVASQLADMLNEAGYIDDAMYFADCVNTIDEVITNIDNLQADLV